MLNIKAPIARTGYGVAAKNIIKHLTDKVDLFVSPISNNISIEENERGLWDKILKNRLPYYDGHSLKIWHQNDLMDHIGRGKKIGFPIFELDTFTQEEKHHISYCDEIFVCSEWGKGIVEKETGRSAHVIPLGVDRSVFFNGYSDHSPTRFFNCGKWEIRKGHDVIRVAFEKAFSKEENVELYMMCHNPFPQVDNSAWERYYRSSPLSDKIKFIEPKPTHHEVALIMQQMDCGVFPARAEGFNLELLECLSCGLDVITTNYSAHTEYCNNDNSYLIDVTEKEPAYDGVWFNNQGNWGKIGDLQIEQMAEYMRDIHNKKQSGRLEINSNGIETAVKFSWENTAQKILEIL